MYRGAGDWGVISDTCISWFLRKAVPFLSTVPDLISYLIFDILISRGRRVDVLTRTVTCKLRTKKRNADETQQWGGETKFYKHRANKLDSECHFFRMVLGRSKSFQSRLLSVSVVTHLYRHHWSSLVQPAASQSLRLPNSSLLYKIQSYSFPDMNFWSFQAFLKFLSVSWDLKKTPINIDHMRTFYNQSCHDLSHLCIALSFLATRGRSLPFSIERCFFFFCLKTWWAVFTSHIKSHESELISKVVDQMHHWSHKTPPVSARTRWDSWNSDSDWTKIVCVGGLGEEKLWKRQNEAAAKAP